MQGALLFFGGMVLGAVIGGAIMALCAVSSRVGECEDCLWRIYKTRP